MWCIGLRRSHHTTQRGFWHTDCGGITRIWFFYRCLQCSPPTLVSNLFHTSDLSKCFSAGFSSCLVWCGEFIISVSFQAAGTACGNIRETIHFISFTNHVNWLKLKQQFQHVIYLLIFYWNKLPFLFSPKKRVEGLTYQSCHLLPLLTLVKRFLALHSGDALWQYSFYRHAADFYDPALPPGFLAIIATLLV